MTSKWKTWPRSTNSLLPFSVNVILALFKSAILVPEVFWPFCSSESNHIMEQFGRQFLSHCPTQSRTVYPLGHFYSSRDTTIKGTQDLVPAKSSYNLCICYLFWTDTSIQGKGTFFLGPETSGFNLNWWITLAIKNKSKKWLTTKIVDISLKVRLSQWWQLSKHELTHLNQCTAFVGIQHTTSQR